MISRVTLKPSFGGIQVAGEDIIWTACQSDIQLTLRDRHSFTFTFTAVANSQYM